jgi:hypothetical protein
MKLPDKPDEYEILANRNLANILRDRLSKLKNEQCQFILCLENCRNPEIHQLFKQIAYTEFGKSFFNEVIHELFLYIQVLLLNVLTLQKFSECQT